jgi:conjugation system TraG family ATPase
MKKKFELPFIGTSVMDGLTLLYGNHGNFSCVLDIRNLAIQYNADRELYNQYHVLLGQIIKMLGADYILQKTDIISRKKYEHELKEDAEYLDKKYFEYFKSRSFSTLVTYLTITKVNTKGRLFSYSEDEHRDFILKVNKVIDLFANFKIPAQSLTPGKLNNLFNRYMTFDFNNERYSFSNISGDDKKLSFGDHRLQVISLIDIDEMNIPNEVSAFTNNAVLGPHFPIDTFSFLLNVPDYETVLYNQVVFIPDQIKVNKDLDAKKRKHTSIPDPANKLAVTDIDDMFLDIAKNNELLVYSHFSILLYAHQDRFSKPLNYIETQLFGLGIIPGKNTYNQLELFRGAIPGNAGEIKYYDKFLTSRPAACTFFFKEALPVSEQSDYLLYFTDRQGVPIGIDTGEQPMHTGRITNRNKFVLGPSGTGKSFFTNRYVKQCKVLGADVILVDTGHSYFGTCEYFKGKYITYKEDKPITMNPFRIEEVENNEEKRQILKTLLGLLWKGVNGVLSQVEDTVINRCIAAYYEDYFGSKKRVQTLSFNSFYEFAIPKIKVIVSEDEIDFNIKEFRFVLQKFYKGGEYDKILNDEFDRSLFNEPFIVFEIDSIKEHPLLFPITTLIIMDVFLQKMRFKSNKKILIIEEAWKAIASPMMAGYILYLYKTVRKFNGEAIVVTQELDDIIGNAIVKNSIIGNSDTICLLDQQKFKDNFDEIAKLLSLNEVEKNKIFTINKLDNKEGRGRFKEVYIKRGATGEVYGVEVPLHEYLTYTTERSEREALEVYLHRYRDMETALTNLVSDLERSGLSLPKFVKKTISN